MRTKIRMIVTDLDGTMFRRANEISQRNYEVICRARQQGILYAVATGRCGELVPEKILPPMDYCITCNGAHICEGETHRLIAMRCMPTSLVLETLRIIRRFRPFLEIFWMDQVVVEQDTMQRMEEYQVPAHHLEYFQTGRQLVVPSLEEFLNQMEGEKVTKINMPCREEGRLDSLRAELKQDRRLTLSSDGFGIELTAPGATKGEALRFLCEQLSIPLKQTAVFGDGANDVSMLSIAGCSVAMGNASVPARSAAQYVTASNREDGVAEFLEQILHI